MAVMGAADNTVMPVRPYRATAGGASGATPGGSGALGKDKL